MVRSVQETFAARECWRISDAARERDPQLIVTVCAEVDRSGVLVAEPVLVDPAPSADDPLLAELQQAALAAVVACAPYDFLPEEHYDRWREIMFTFRTDMPPS